MTEHDQSHAKLPQNPEPYWRDGIEFSTFNELNEDLKVDTVIVGGGITGITAAYLLVKEGQKVALLEADQLLNGTTGYTTAKITAQHDLIYDEFMNHFGTNKTRMYYEANIEAKNFIEKTIQDLKINCDYSKQTAYLFATTEEYAHKVEIEFEAYQKLKIDGQLLNEIPFNIKIHKALSMENQAQFHPLKYLTHLVQEVEKAGGLIFENTTAVNIDRNGSEVSVLTRNGFRVTGQHILSCSHFPFYEGTGFYFSRLYAKRSYILAAKTKDKFPGGMYLSVDTPNRSLRSTTVDGEELVLIAGENHKTGQGKDTMQHYKALEAFGHDVFNIEEYVYRWSAQDLITLDKIPYVGEITADQPNVLIATGYRKWGMTNGTSAALQMRDIVLGRDNRYKSVFAPDRFYADPSLKKFFMENANVAKHLIKGKLEVTNKTVKDISKNEGAVVMINGEKKGAYKDDQGRLHLVDTTCKHMGCEVHWNSGEKTWDCPCHGSRFSYEGDVVEGPAEKPLEEGDFSMIENLTSEDSGY